MPRAWAGTTWCGGRSTRSGRTEFETITAAIDEVTGGAEHPAQTIVGVTGLAVPGLLIEIECTAVRAID